MYNSGRNIAQADATRSSIANPFIPPEERTNYLSTMAEYLVPDLSPIGNMAHDVGTMLGVNQDRYKMTGSDAMALAMAAIGGIKPTGKKRIKLTHYSREARPVLDPNFLGTGAASQELQQGIPKTKWVNYYMGGKPEPRIVNQFPVKHTVEGSFNLIDLASPEALPLIEKAKKKAFVSKNGNMTEHLTKVIKDAGHEGYYNSEAPLSNVVRLFSQQKPTNIVTKNK